MFYFNVPDVIVAETLNHIIAPPLEHQFIQCNSSSRDFNFKFVLVWAGILLWQDNLRKRCEPICATQWTSWSQCSKP